MNETPDHVTLVPIHRNEVLNSRDRNLKIFEESAPPHLERSLHFIQTF